MRLLALIALVVASFPHGASGTVHCVRAGDAACFATIPGALAAATDGDTIRVAAGTYIGAITIDENVVLEGGWNASFTARDPASFVSTIVPAVGDTSSVVSISGSSANPAASTPILDGFTITGGRADLGFNHGGGVRIRDSQATVRSCVISGNRGYLLGGGVWVQRGAPRFQATRIESNVATEGVGFGGGVMVEDASATLEDSVIQGNSLSASGGSGGGIMIQNGGPTPTSLVIRGATIASNSAGPSCQGYGGGVFVQAGANREISVILDRARFSANCGQFEGGAIAIDSTGSASYSITNSTFALDDGGGNGDEIHVATDLATGVLRNVTLVGRPGAGRGITANGRLSLVNSIVQGFEIGVDYFNAVHPLMATFNGFHGNVTDLKVNNVPTAPDASNLLVDPLLDATQHLQAGSAMIDAGTRTPGPFRDIDGGPRPTAGPSGRFRLDIGADELLTSEAQLVHDEVGDPVDLAVVGPGDPPEDPNDTTTNNEPIGYSALGADFSGDGKDDFLVAAEDWSNDFDDPAQASTGRLFGLFNFGTRRTGALDLFLDTQEDLTIRSELMRQHMGSELASGDVNGDGDLDLLIGSFEDDNVGDVIPKAFVLFGGPGLAGLRSVSAAIPADFTLVAPDFDFGAFSEPNALAAGDLNGGGIADLVVGDSLADDGANTDAGAVFVIFGRSDLAGARDLATMPADLTLYGPSANANLGSLALGDVNGDAALDLVARTPMTAYVLFGPLAGGVRRLASVPADVTITGLAAGRVIVADVTGEGKPDLVLGSGAELRVIPGPFTAGQSLSAATAATLVLTGAGAFPGSLALGDVIGDPRPDLIVLFGGQAYVLAGGVKATGNVPIDEVASAAVVESSGKARFFAVAAGDFDDDGRKDVVVTDRAAPPYQDHGFPDANDAGRAYVIYGGDPVDNCPGLSNPTQVDDDADGAGDACDNCPFHASSSFADADGDGRGDACECTDQNGDGRNTVSDIVAISTAIFNPGLVTPLCDGNNDGRCDVRDIIAANIEIFSPTSTSICARQPVPGP